MKKVLLTMLLTSILLTSWAQIQIQRFIDGQTSKAIGTMLRHQYNTSSHLPLDTKIKISQQPILNLKYSESSLMLVVVLSTTSELAKKQWILENITQLQHVKKVAFIGSRLVILEC